MAQNTASRSKHKNNLKKTYAGKHFEDFGTSVVMITENILPREEEIARRTRARNQAFFKERCFDIDALMAENKDFSVSLPDNFGEKLKIDIGPSRASKKIGLDLLP